MDWTSKYVVDIKVEDGSTNGVNIQEVAPNNNIDNWKVSQTLGYTIGANAGVSVADGASAGVNFEYNSSRTVEYEQNEYSTFVTRNTTNEVFWRVVYKENKDGYNRTSDNPLYGNQLFMISRLYNTGDKNLVTDLPALIKGGFAPSFALGLRAPKNTTTSIIKLSLGRGDDFYQLRWNGVNWIGFNNLDTLYQEDVVRFEINWVNHTIKVLS